MRVENQEAQYVQRDLAAWTHKQNDMRKNISDVGVQPLKVLLGEHFQTIMDLRPIEPLPFPDHISAYVAQFCRTIDLSGRPASATHIHQGINHSRPASHGVIDLTIDSAGEVPGPPRTETTAMPRPNGNGPAIPSATFVPFHGTVAASRPAQYNSNNVQGPPPAAGLITNAALVLPPISSMLVPNPTSNEASSSSTTLPLGSANGNVFHRLNPPQRRNLSMISGDENENAMNITAFDRIQLKRLKIDAPIRRVGYMGSIANPQSTTTARHSAGSIAAAAAPAVPEAQQQSRSASGPTISNTNQVV
jgi:hypothetical protein